MPDDRLSGDLADPESVRRYYLRDKRKSWFRRGWNRVKRVSVAPGWLVYGIPALALYLLNIRFVKISNPGRIGHVALEPDWFVKEMTIGARPRVTPVLLMADKDCPNPCLLEYWEQYFRVVRNRFVIAVLRPFRTFPFLRVNLFESYATMRLTGKRPEILALWGSRPPLLELSESHRARGRAALAELGIPKDAWFVCVHSRDAGYSPGDEHVHGYRNSAIGSYALAMDAIVERGGWCIRVGGATMQPLGSRKGVVDYACSPLKSDWMDIFLSAECRFFLGNTSGLYVASYVFGVPAALANLTPLAHAYPLSGADLGIPKLLARPSGDIVPFAEILESPAANFMFTAEFESGGLENVDNTAGEIRDIAVEMMDRLDGAVTCTDEDARLQERFRVSFAEGRCETGPQSRIGRDFLRKYSNLL